MAATRSGRARKNDILRLELDNDRSSFKSHWRDLSDYFLPRRTRFTVTDVNRGEYRNNKIINSTGTLAARTLRSGMMAGITSPARPWFKLSTESEEQNEFGPIKIWLEQVTRKLRSIFLKSNLYNVLPICYGDLGVFSTGCILMEEDFERVVRFYSLPLGSFWIANDDKLRVRTFYREFKMSVSQIVQKFGKVGEDGKPDWSNISEHVKNLWENDNKETKVDIAHVIKPNDRYVPDSFDPALKKYASHYWEKGAGYETQNLVNGYSEADQDKLLRESGYDHFPVLGPRWEVTGEDSYGTNCPGMTALGDCKALQTMEKRLAQGLEKLINPPMTGPTALRNAKASILPGDITYDDVREGQKGFRPSHEVDPRVQEITIAIEKKENQIKEAFFVNLFLMLAESDRREITAREVDERHEEKLLGLGPVLENLNQDLLDPLIENTFNFAFAQGLIPEPPEELQGQDLKVEYISIMAQAQKLAGIASLERFVAFAVNLAKEIKVAEGVNLLDKLNFDQIIDVYADRMGVDPDIVVTDADVAYIRESRAAQQKAMQALEFINQGADTMQKLSGANLEDDSILKRAQEAIAK